MSLRAFSLRRTARACTFVIGALMLSCFAGPLPAEAQPITPPTPTATSAPACVVAPRPNSLWSLAQCCSRNLHSNSGCRAYDATDQYIILKDNSPRKPAAYLIIPTIKVTGIDDKQIFSPPVNDLWQYGWRQAQILVKKPAADIGLAINSKRGRTQNQLHIHIACVLPTVAQTLAAHMAEIASNPATAIQLTLAPAGHVYRVIKTAALAGAKSPFRLVAAMPGATDMADQSIAVIGSETPGTFYILDTTAHRDNPGAAEELLDQSCRS